jgi:hypothetical protein
MEILTIRDRSHFSAVMLYEPDLFDYLKKWYFPDLEKSRNRMDHYDCFSRKYRVVIELKCRRTHYDELMMEKSKYDKLISMKWNPIYINSTPKGVFAFKVREIEPNWVTDNRMPNKTDLVVFSSEKEKTYTLLHISKAKQI